MAGILGWLKNGSTKLFDPHRDVRVRNAADEVERQLATKREAFNLDRSVVGLDLFPQDVPLVANEVYRSLLQRAWKDERISEGEHKTLRWAAGKLGLDAKTCNELKHEEGVRAFQRASWPIRFGMGFWPRAKSRDYSQSPLSSVGRWARSCGIASRTNRGMFLRRLFLTSIEDGRLVESEWTRLIKTTESIGLSKTDLLNAIQPQAERFVEHLFADSKADLQDIAVRRVSIELAAR